MIRKGTIDDMPELLRLSKEFHYASSFRHLSSFEDSVDGWANWVAKCISGDDLLCLVSDDGKTLTGFMTAIMFPAFWKVSILYVSETVFWVGEEHRGGGVGTSLLAGLVDWATEIGASVVSAGSTVSIKPKEMGRLLNKNGFQLKERHYTRRIK